MSEFSQVTVIKKANVYFDGKVNSRTIQFANGERKTLGFIAPGEYTFDTSVDEEMELLAGDMEVRLPGEDAWRSIQVGEVFRVPAKTDFSVRIRHYADYCCSYGK